VAKSELGLSAKMPTFLAESFFQCKKYCLFCKNICHMIHLNVKHPAAFGDTVFTRT
jgi:hypothetical protein